MDLGSKGLTFDLNVVKGRELETFIEQYNILTKDELKESLQVSRAQFSSVLSGTVPCVGCRRSVDRLFDQLMDTVYPTIYPIIITSNGTITISPDKIRQPSSVCAILYRSDDLLNQLVEMQPRNKKTSSRCSLHSLDSFRSRPFSEVWRDVWNCMNKRCREEIAVVEAEELHATLDGYLKKHKFCSECRTKVEKAYTLLINENNPSKENGYVASLYAGIKKCITNKHIHLQTKLDYIDTLIKKAEPELNGSHFRNRERHAKTLEIAQEEVLTCIGMCIYEKLRRIHVCLREEENACQILGAVAVSTLARNFDMAVENKSGISKLELYYQELESEEKLKEQRKEQKKLKKRRKRNEKKNNNQRTCDACDDECIADVCSHDEETEDAPVAGNDEEEDGEEVEKDNISVASVASCHCHDTNNGDIVCTQTSIDGGYSSEHHEGSCSRTLLSAASSLHHTPEGSEVACSDGLCDHEDSAAHNKSSRSSPECCSKFIGSSPGFTCLLEKMLVSNSTFLDLEPNTYCIQ